MEVDSGNSSANTETAEKKCRCGGTDHQRTSSSKCPWNKKHNIEQSEAEQHALLDNVEVDDDVQEETEELLLAISEEADDDDNDNDEDKENNELDN